MKRHMGRWIAAGLGILLAAGFIVSQIPRPPKRTLPLAAAAPPKRAGSTTARREVVPVRVEAIGSLDAKRRAILSARILARILEVRRRPGEGFEAGETLVVLDGEDLKARVAGAEALLQASEESFRDARTEEARAKSLLEKDAITRQDYDARSARLAESAARREAARKALDAARVEAAHATILAPFRGVVVEKRAEPGDTASPGAPLLEVCDPSELRLDVAVDERLAMGLALGDEVPVSIDATAETLPGRVGELVPAVDPSTRTQRARIDLAARAGLKPGMAARARIPAGTREAIVVEGSAVVRRGQLEIVFALERAPQSAAATARLRLVRTSREADAALGARGLVEILSGIEPGLPIALPAAGLEDGAAVEAPPGPAGEARR